MCPFNQRFAEEAAEPRYAARGPAERPAGVEALPREDDFDLTDSAESHPGTDGPPLTELLRTALSEEAWDAFSRGSAIRRAGRVGFARNVCVAMGNWLEAADDPDRAAMRLLKRALSDPDPLVRGHAVWALGMVGSGEAREALASLLESEDNLWVQEEIGWVLARWAPASDLRAED